MENQQPNLEPKPKLHLKYILIVFILVVLVGGGILVYQYWKVLEPPVSYIPKNNLDFNLESKKIFVAENYALYAVDPKTSEKLLIDDSVASLSYTRGYGYTVRALAVVPLIAYADRSGKLKVSDAMGNKVVLTEAPPETQEFFINGWSLDYRRLLYVVEEATHFGESPSRTGRELSQGFYVADFGSNKVYRITFDGIGDYRDWEYMGWLDDRSVLFKKEDVLFEYTVPRSFFFITKKHHLALFERFGNPGEKHSSGFGQFYASPKGLYAYVEGAAYYPYKGESDFSAVYFYDGTDLNLIKKGTWVDYQWPLISPDGSSVVVNIIETMWDTSGGGLLLYDAPSRQERVLPVRGMALDWFDDSKILIDTNLPTYPTFLRSLFLYDIDDGSSHPIQQ